ncbi:hypothetical protein H0H92_004979, partial [Tricholoma furcatifolium]
MASLETLTLRLPGSLSQVILSMDFPWHRIDSLTGKDTFHVFNMLYISRAHGLCIPFAQALRDAIFVPNPQDKQQIEAWLTTATSLKWDDI